VAKQENELKEFFMNGPGSKCNLASLYFQLLVAGKEFVIPPGSTRLLFGQEHLENEIAGMKFAFFPQNYYPRNVEAFKNMSKSVGEMLRKSLAETGTDILIDNGCSNGVIATLAAKHNYKQYCLINHAPSTTNNFSFNLEQNGINVAEYATFYTNFRESIQCVNKVVKKNGPDSKICFVWEPFYENIVEFKRLDREF
jgi:tRNA/tmRNA/rRNA uracil-C5-methylase (TrmA/RlmC/RlmD family)